MAHAQTYFRQQLFLVSDGPTERWKKCRQYVWSLQKFSPLFSWRGRQTTLIQKIRLRHAVLNNSLTTVTHRFSLHFSCLLTPYWLSSCLIPSFHFFFPHFASRLRLFISSAHVSDGPSGASVSLSADISAPWFQSNYTEINDDSPWMHVSTLSVSPSGTGPGAQQSQATTRQVGARISQNLTCKDKKDFSFSYFSEITQE